MYEDKTRRSIQINWKSLLIKLGILLVVIFIIIWIVSIFNKDEEVTSNFGTNLQSMRNAATEYFTGSRLPNEINESTSLTLKEMFERKLLVEFQDENGNSCDVDNSYIEATKIDDENYRIEVRLVCDNDSDTIINTVKYQSQNNDDEETDENVNDDPVIDDTNNDEDTGDLNNLDNNSNNNQNNSNSQSQSNNNQANNQKPNNSGSSSNNSSSNSNSNNNNSNNNSSSNNSQNTIATACSYGKKEYSTTYPLAYVVNGDCAVSLSSISGSHANNATRIGNVEYLKLTQEMKALEEKTGIKITVSNPQYSKVLNKTGKGYVGYQIYFSAKQVTNYATKTIYSYYLDQNGNRTVIIDSRNSLSSSNNSSISTNISVNNIVINRSSLTLDVGDTYILSATITPTNATNQTVTWSSSNTKVATVSNSGKVTAKGEGTTIITAKAGGKTDTVKVIVNEEYISVTRVELNRASLSLDVGDAYTLRATITPTNATNQTVTWSSSNTKVATVSSSGKVTAKNEGTATITAKVNGKIDTVRVTVNEEEVYRYCSTNTTRVYSIGYINSSTILNRYSYSDNYSVIYSNNDAIDIVDIDYGNITYNDEYLKAYNYWKNDSTLTLANSLQGEGVDPGTYGNLRDSSLKTENYLVRVSYTGKIGNKYYFNIYRSLYNLQNIRYAEPYRNVYFLPLYFDIVYIDYSDCRNITASQTDNYEDQGYVQV